jgi:RNA polymerase primary sigma factor
MILKRARFRDEEILSDYLTEIRRIPLLTPENERKLAYRIREGDRKALEDLVLANLRFVVSMAKRYIKAGGPIMDMINEGNLALIRAAETFNPDLGLRFISYAVWWIRKYIFHFLSRSESPVAIPERKAHVVFKLNRIRESLYRTLKREPKMSELAKEVNLPEAKVAQFVRVMENHVSLDSLAYEFRFTDGQSDGEQALNDLETQSTRVALSSEVLRCLNRLKEKERSAVELYFGFNGQDKVSYEKIGRQINLSREGARRTVQRAIQKLSRDPEIKHLRPYLEQE